MSRTFILVRGDRRRIVTWRLPRWCLLVWLWASRAEAEPLVRVSVGVGMTELVRDVESMRPADESAEWQGYAFRAFGEGIQEIGMRALVAPLTADEIAAVAFIARNVLEWCGESVSDTTPPQVPPEVGP